MIALETLSPGALFLVGLFGAPHCIGMCGGIIAAIGLGPPRLRLIAGYNLGRVLSYTGAGVLVGLVGGFAENYLALAPLLRTLAAVLLILMGCYLAGWSSLLTLLEKLGQYVWQRVQPQIVRLGPAQGFPRAFVLGMLWGWLPCGLVYSALAYALATGSPVGGGLAMLAFGAGTLPALIASGWFAAGLRRWMQAQGLRALFGLLLIAMGVWNLWQLYLPLDGHTRHMHQQVQIQN